MNGKSCCNFKSLDDEWFCGKRQTSQIVTFYWNTDFLFHFIFFPASVDVKNEKCENVGRLASAELLNGVSRSLAHSCSGWDIKFAGDEDRL